MDELEYRRLLKQVPAEIAPPRDLWPGISQRLAPRVAQRNPWLMRGALAAGLAVLGVALLTARFEPRGASADLVKQQAMALRAETQSALLSEASGYLLAREHGDPRLLAALTEIDAAERSLDAALKQEPQSAFLLDSLKRVQEQRTRLARKALFA